MGVLMISDKEITEHDLKLQAELLYRDIEDYIRRYPLYVEIPKGLVDLKFTLQDYLKD
jgi:hypothetical protein